MLSSVLSFLYACKNACTVKCNPHSYKTLMFKTSLRFCFYFMHFTYFVMAHRRTIVLPSSPFLVCIHFYCAFIVCTVKCNLHSYKTLMFKTSLRFCFYHTIWNPSARTHLLCLVKDLVLVIPSPVGPAIVKVV